MKDRIKVYHGIPKSVPDENTIFYASFDYTKRISGIRPDNFLVPSNVYGKMAHGGGIIVNKKANIYDDILIEISRTIIPHTSDLTVEFWMYPTSNTGLPCQIGYHQSNNFRTYTQIINESLTTKHFKVNEYNHFRLTVTKGYIEVYINGIKTAQGPANYTTDVSYTDVTKNLKIRIGGDNNASVFNMDSVIVSDVHISNISKGNSFPNIPQDFTEGKAIIKEKLGQQQIKGDPAYSQVTELRVPTQPTNALNTIYDLNDKDSDLLERCFTNPELRASYCHSWAANNSKIRIKGLNGEIISGVIDTDTALCRVVKDNKNIQNITEICVDDVSGLIIGDIIRVYVPFNGVISREATISGIDAETKTITLSSKLIDNTGSAWGEIDLFKWGPNYVVETTASSSSPIVKSQDGQTVVGTWSGLGTNEATFTLGNNTPSLIDKDLYVTYSLNIPSNNSHFPEIPYSVDKAFTETGVEMKPVTEIIIEDDFRGKISGSTKECPHVYKVNTGDSLLSPSGFTQEQSSESYSRIIVPDNSTSSTQSTTNNSIPKQLFGFNLIEIIERKLGCPIPSHNKVQWLKDNIDVINASFYGCGKSSSGDLVVYKCWNGTAWAGNLTSNSPSVTLSNFKITISVVSNHIYIGSDGWIHFMAHTNASDGVTPSNVFTDYVLLKVTLRLPPNYQALYCDNKRAREDKCNPILVQKETKTVKRLIPSKECFTTESKSGTNKLSYGGNNLIRSDIGYLSSQGTSGNMLDGDAYKCCLAKLGFVSDTHRFDNNVLKQITQFPDLRFFKIDCQNYYSNNEGTVPQESLDKTYVSLHPSLTVRDGEIKLKILAREVISGSYNNIKPYGNFSLPNRPLIK